MEKLSFMRSAIGIVVEILFVFFGCVFRRFEMAGQKDCSG